MPATLGYWYFSCFGEPIRLLLEYVGMPYEDKRYELGPTMETIRDPWLKEKFTLGLEFPNLPYFIDGDVRVTQSVAILRYIARKHNMTSASESDQIRTDMAEQQAVDLSKDLAALAYGPDFEANKVKYLAALPDKLSAYNAFLGGKYDWFGGSRISHADFLLYVFLHWHRLLDRQCMEAYEHLQAFFVRFEALERVSEYIKSDKFRKVTVFSPVASWGNKVIDF